MSAPTPTPERSRLVTALTWSGAFVALLWAIELVDTLLRHRLDAYGVHPRSLEGLWGVLTAPLLHTGWAHLMSNTAPAFVLSFVIIISSGTTIWAEATAIVWLVGGLGTWLIGASFSNHIGASGVVFGWVTFLVLRGVFARKISQIVIGIGVFVVYGYVLWGVFPTTAQVSWEGHLSGAIGGVIAAVVLGRRSLEQRDEATPTP